MKTDRELLELAAKAVGLAVRAPFRHGEFRVSGEDWISYPWNPLNDDGDALRLAVNLRMEIDHNHPADETMWVSVRAANQSLSEVEEIDGESQREAATRRAIVLAAAAIGESMS